MHFLTFLPVALLSTLGLASASAIPARANGSPALTWHVSNLTTGCSPGGCTYKFNIKGVETENTPGFDTTCSGTDTQKDYKACDDKEVRAIIKPETYPMWNIQVKHVWDGGIGEHMTIGKTNVTANTAKFEIPVSQQYGVGAS